MSDNPNFVATMSTDEIYVGQEPTICLTDVLEEKAEAGHNHDSEYATIDHTHSGYALQDDLDLLTDVVNTKASASHTHSGYASSTHTHSEYAAVEDYIDVNEVLGNKADIDHIHGDYALVEYVQYNYATTTDLDALSATVSNKADSYHSHDDMYYTETEIDTKLAGKSDSSHTHTSIYDVSGAAAEALTSANTYTDSKINALVGSGASTTLDTIGEISAAIEDNQDAIDLLNAAIANKANVSHTHAVSEVTNLQDTLDGKAASSHGTHVSFSTTTPVMDGTASVGTASTVARSDHKHPVDTSRAAQTSLDSHTSNKSNPHSVTLAQLGVTATAAELNVLDGITATVTELNYVDGVTSNIQTQLNGKLSTTGKAASATTADSATNVTWSGVTSKPSYYDAKAIKSIARNGTTFTYTCMDETTGTFTQQDNNTTYSVVTTSANGLMIASDKSKLDGMELATVSEVETYLAI